MSKPTHDQIIEGRDEALDHLGIKTTEWERMPHDKRRNRMRFEAARSTTHKAAAQTVAISEEALSTSPLGSWLWLGVNFQVLVTEPLRQTDYALQA